MVMKSTQGKGTTGRRGFFGRVGGLAVAVGGLLGIPGCDTVSGGPQYDFSMHGPVQASDWALTLPEAPSAAPLFAPYDDGRPFLRRWAVGRRRAISSNGRSGSRTIPSAGSGRSCAAATSAWW